MISLNFITKTKKHKVNLFYARFLSLKKSNTKGKYMSKSIKNFYKVVVVAILIMALSVSLTIYRDNKALRNKNSSSSVGITQGTDGLEDLFEKDDTQDGESTTAGDSTIDKEQSQTKVPVYTNGFKCFQDALTKLNNSAGYKAVTTSAGQATIFGITETQFIKETFILSGDYYLREQQGYCTSPVGKLFYRYWYSNDNAKSIRYKETTKLTENSLEAKPDWSGKNIDTTITLEELYNYDPYPYNVFSVLPSKRSELVGSFDPTEDPKYYVVRFKLDLATVPQAFVDSIIREGDLTAVELFSLERTFYIEKSTLNIRKIDRVDTYNMEKGIAKGLCVYTSQTVFVGIDKVYQISEPA